MPACRKLAFYNRIANAKSSISSVYKLFPSLVTAQLSASAALWHISLLVRSCLFLCSSSKTSPIWCWQPLSSKSFAHCKTFWMPLAFQWHVFYFFSHSTCLCWQWKRDSSEDPLHHGLLLRAAIAVKSQLCLCALVVHCIDKLVPIRHSKAMQPPFLSCGIILDGTRSAERLTCFQQGQNL